MAAGSSSQIGNPSYHGRVHPSRIVIVVGTALAAGSTLLPFISSDPTGSVRGARETFPVVALLIPLLVAALLGDRREGFPRWGAVTAALVAAVAMILSVVKMIDAMRAVRDLQSIGIDAVIGLGPWVLAAGAFAGLMGAALSLSRRLA